LVDAKRRAFASSAWSALSGFLSLRFFFKLRPAGLKLIQSLLQVGHFLLDFPKLCLFLATRQTISAKLLGDVMLKLTPQDPEIWVSPYRPFPVLKLAGSDAFL